MLDSSVGRALFLMGLGLTIPNPLAKNIMLCVKRRSLAVIRPLAGALYGSKWLICSILKAKIRCKRLSLGCRGSGKSLWGKWRENEGGYTFSNFFRKNKSALVFSHFFTQLNNCSEHIRYHYNRTVKLILYKLGALQEIK